MADPIPRPPAPMPPLGTQEIFTIALIGRFTDAETVTLFHYQGNQPLQSAVSGDMIALHDLFTGVGGVLDPFLGAVSADWTFVATTIFSPTQPSLATLISEGTGEIGLGPAGALPNQAAVTIQRRTAWRGKHGQGRISVPAVPAVWVAKTYLQVATAYDNLKGAMLADLSDGIHTFTPGIVARSRDKTTGQVQLGWRPLSFTSVNQTLGTCRRRKPGVGK